MPALGMAAEILLGEVTSPRDCSLEPDPQGNAHVLLVVTKAFEHVGVAAPVFVDFDVEFDVDLFAEKFFEIGSGLYSYSFECFAFVTDYDAFLGFALYHD